MKKSVPVKRVLAHVVAAEIPVAVTAGYLFYQSTFSAYAQSLQGERDMVVAGTVLASLFLGCNGSILAAAAGAALSFVPRLPWLATFGASALAVYLWVTT